MKLKDYFNIPNILGYIRIILLPVFLVMYRNAETTGETAAAFAVLAVSMLTDLFDGKIARKYNMVTDFGKALDPVADKLTQLVLIIVLIEKYRLIWVLLIVSIVKELYMAIMGSYIIKTRGIYVQAEMQGKAYTMAADICIFILLLVPKLPEAVANTVTIILSVWAAVTALLYLRTHLKVLRETPRKEKN